MPIVQGGPDRGARPDEHGLGIHAGYTETSVRLHLRPDLVHLDQAVRSVLEKLTTYERGGFGKLVSFGWLSDDFGTDVTIGDPTGANAEAGKTHFEVAVAGWVESLHEIATFLPS